MLYDKLAGNYYQTYLMTDSYIQAGSGKTTSVFSYKGIKVFIIRKTYLQLKGRFRRFKIFVAQEDMSFVKNYIMGRLPGDADIRCQIHDSLDQ